MELTEKQMETLKIKDNRLDFYFKVENAVIDEYQNFDNIYESHLFIVLSRYCNNGQVAFPSYETLAKQCYCSKRHIIKMMKNLEEKKLINKVIRNTEKVFKSNLYTVNSIKKYSSIDKKTINSNEREDNKENSEGSESDSLGVLNNIHQGNECSSLGVANGIRQGSEQHSLYKDKYIKNNFIKKERETNVNSLSHKNNVDSIKLKQIDELKNIIANSLKKERKDIDDIVDNNLYLNIDIELLIKKIKDSSYLQGINTKPFISIFTTLEGIKKILYGFYDDYSKNTSKIIKIRSHSQDNTLEEYSNNFKDIISEILI
ncbi:MAG: helix-turn-helix domain-containing protein [Fusobacterium necrophorum]|nr:helix-turn-helix domain-containing protein [Fusobacterium necrophorum]